MSLIWSALKLNNTSNDVTTNCQISADRWKQFENSLSRILFVFISFNKTYFYIVFTLKYSKSVFYSCIFIYDLCIISLKCIAF